MNNRLINTKVAGGGGGCTDIVDNYDPFGGNGVALYQLNGNATDVSGNYNGTWNGTAAYTTGVFGQAANFNSVTSSIDTFYVHNNSSWTFSMWVNARELTSNVGQDKYPTIIGALDAGGVLTNNGTIWMDSSKIMVLGTTRYGSVDFSFSLNTWYHVGMVFDDATNTLKAIINGTLYDATILGTPTFSNQTNLRIGRAANNNSAFDGIIDQVRFFDTALTPLEVEALYTEELCICDGTVDTLDILGDGSCIATYPLDGNANDLSGNYSGTPTNVSYGVGEFDLAGVFNGSNSYVVIDDSPALRLTGSYTVSLWVKFNSFSTFQRIITKDNANDYSGGYSFNANSTNIYWQHNNGSATDVVFPNTLSTATWYNLCIVYDSSNTSNNLFFYVNGVLEVTDSAASPIIGEAGNKLFFGTYGSSSPLGQYLNGDLDQVRIFNKALNSTEVTTLYNETACTKITKEAGATQILGDSSCIAYYKLDGTAVDETGSYSGTFTSPDYRNGEFDLAANFTGSNGITTPVYNRPGNTAWSFSAWTKINSNATGSLGAFFNGTVAYEEHLFFNVYQGRIQFGQYGSVAYGENLLPTNQWLHLVYTRNTDSSVACYLNGSPIVLKSGSDGSGTVVTSFATLNLTNEPFNIGKHGAGGNYTGLIDQIRVFNKAVSPSEVTTLYNEGI